MPDHPTAAGLEKGSYGRRIKTISFAEDTVILLQRYFDQERVRFDPHGYPLDLYLELAARKQVDLSTWIEAAYGLSFDAFRERIRSGPQRTLARLHTGNHGCYQ